MNTTATYQEQQQNSSGGNFWTDVGDLLGFGAARRNREFQAEQAELAHQRAIELRQTNYQDNVASMTEAGVNPAMAFSGSAGTPSTPSGAQASSSAPPGSALGQMSSLINSVSNVASSFNNDKDSSNNISLSDAMKAVSFVASILK